MLIVYLEMATIYFLAKCQFSIWRRNVIGIRYQKSEREKKVVYFFIPARTLVSSTVLKRWLDG